MGAIRDYGGRAAIYGDRKTRHSISMTDIAWDRIDKLAALLGLSRSDFLERLGRGMITPQVLQDIYKEFSETP